MPSENTTKVSLPTKTTESRWLAIANLPETATEDSIKECFKRHGRVQSVKINEQGFAFVAYLDIRTASKAHNSENILDEQLLRTAFHDGSNSVPKALLDPPPPIQPPSSNALPEQPSPLTPTTITEPSFSSSSNTTTVTNSLSSKAINGERDKRPSRTLGSPDENVRHQVVPVKHDSDSSGSKRKTSSTNMSKSTSNSHSTKEKLPRRKHDNSSSSSSSSSSSESDRSSDDSISCKNHRRRPNKTHTTPVNDSASRTKILKIYHLPKMTKESLRESLWKLFVDFKEKGRLLKVQIDGEHESRFALLTFQKAEHVDKALTFAISKNLNGSRLKAEPYDGTTNETDECDIMKRTICTDPDIDEYSIKATRTLYIGNLQSEISYYDLRETYSAYGDIVELEIKRQTQSPHQLPFAFVQYADIKSVVKAMKAFESKLVRDHSIKLGFGKSQPTNVLWLDELPLTVSELSVRSFILRQTKLPTDQVLDIYIDNRNNHKTQTAQCLIYFADSRAAQEAINLIRGKKIESKRIQVDFAGKVFVTRFSDIIEEASQKKNYVGYPPDVSYHGDSRSVSKRNGTGREILTETIQPFDTSSTRPNSGDRWLNAYSNNGRSQHKSDSRHSSDRRHSKEYGKGTSASLISIPSIDNGSLPGAAVGTRRHRLSTSSKDSLSNNVSSGRNPRINNRSRHHASSTSSSSSRSSSSSSHSSVSTNSLEHRSNSHQKRHSSKRSPKVTKKQNKSSTTAISTSNNNTKTSSGKKSTTNKEQSVKSSHRSRSNKSEKDMDISTNIPNSDANLVSNPLLDEQTEQTKKESSPQPSKQQQQQQTSVIQPSSSPKAPLKDNDRIFDWLMQNQLHDSNSSTGLDQTEDDEHLLKRKPDDDSLENISDEQTSKTSPPIQNNNSNALTDAKTSSMIEAKNSKNDKPLSTAAYRLQPIRTGKRDEQTDSNSVTNEIHLSPTHSTSNVCKDEIDPNLNNRRLTKVKYHLPTNQTRTIPLESSASYDQLDVRLKSYPSLFNDHIESIRLPFPQFAFEHIKKSSTSASVLVVLNPKAHLKHSSLGLNNPSTTSTTTLLSSSTSNLPIPSLTTTSNKLETLIDTNLSTNTDEDPSTTRIPLDERIRLLDKQMHEMNHVQQKSAASSSSSSSSSSLSPATLIEQQNQKNSSISVTITTSTTTTMATTPSSLLTTPSVANLNTTVKSVNDLLPTLSTSSNNKLAQCIQAARAAVLNPQSSSSSSISPSKTTPTLSTASPFHFPTASVPSMNLTRTLSTASPSSVSIPSVLTPPPPPPPPLPFSNLSRLPDPSSTSILTTFQAAFTQTQMVAAAAAKYSSMPFTTTLHPPPPPVPASLISPSLNLNSPSSTTSTLTTSSNNNNNNNNNLMSNLTLPPPPTPPPSTLPNNHSTSVNLLSPPISNIPSNTSFSESSTTSPSTSSAKILERLGPSAKFKRKPIPPPLAVVTTPTTPTNVKDSSVLPSPESTAPVNPVVNSGGTNSPPVLQSQLSNSSTGLKSILKQRSLSNSSSLSPTSERKSGNNFASPRTSTETRPNVPVTPTTNRSASTDSTSKRTPPSTSTTEKKKPANPQDSSVFTSDVDERQSDDKKSTWRTPPTKQQLSSNEILNIKKPILDKIPKKSTATPATPSTPTTPVTPKPAPVDTTKSTVKTTKPIKQSSLTSSLGSKVPQLTLERIDTKSIKPSVETPTKVNNNKPVKVKRVNVLQSDSDTDKKSTSNDAQKTKKSLLNNDITKRKQQHQQKPIPTKKTTTTTSITKPTAAKPAAKIVRKRSTTTETHSSASDVDEKKVEHMTTTTTDQDQDSSDEDNRKVKKRTKTVPKTKTKSSQNSTSWKDLTKGTSMYDRIKKRPRNEQTRNSSLSTSESHLSDENSDAHDDDDDNDDDDDDDDDNDNKDFKRTANRRTNVTSRRQNFTIETSDSEPEPPPLKTKAKKELVFDNNIFDAEESDEKSKPLIRKSKVNQIQSSQETKKPVLKTNNEQTKKDRPSKVSEEQSITKKKIPVVTKVVEKKKSTVNTTKPIPKISKPSTPAQKRPSTDESNESNKKQKVDDEQHPSESKQTQSEISVAEKPSIVVTSPKNDSTTTTAATLPKIDEPRTETTPQTTPTKFGIVFQSHHRHSTTTPSSKRTLSTETPTSHDTSRNDDDDMSEDHESVSTKTNNNINDQSTTNSLKPPAVTQPPLSDDETLNPETMQLSDLIGGNRREDAKPTAGRGAGKGKRATKQDTVSNKRQQAKTNAKSVQSTKSNEKQIELSALEPAASIPTTSSKRPSTTETSSTSSPINDKEAKRLRKSTDDATTISQIKIEPVESHSQIINTSIKEENIESNKQDLLVPPSITTAEVVDQPTVTSMETDPVSLPSTTVTTITVTTITPTPTASTTTTTTAPSSSSSSSIPLVSTTSPETENAIKAVYSTISIPQQSISKTPAIEKSTPIIAPISKETLTIVEHQPTPIQTTSILPSHVSIKSSLTSSALNENVEETLSAVNSLLMLNNNPPNPSGDHPAMKGAARVTPTISKPVYSLVTSLPSPTDQQTRQAATISVTTSVPTPTTQQNDLITMVSNIVSSSNMNTDKPSIVNTTPANTSSRSHIEEVIDDVAKGTLTTSVATATPVISEPITSIVETNTLPTASSSSITAPKSTSIPNIVRDVMRTPCLTSSTTATTATTTTAGTETLNIFDAHRRSTSPLKTLTTSVPSSFTSTTTTTTTTTSSSSTPVAPVVVRPTSSKTPTSHKRSATPKTDLPLPSTTTTTTTPSPIMHPFPHMLTPDGSIFAAAAVAAASSGHHPNFPISLYGLLPSNAANPSLVSKSPPLATRTSANRSNSPSTNSHITVNPLINTITSGQQKSTPSNSQTHEKASRRESSNKGSTVSTSSSSRSTPIQQTVPVPIPLTIPSSTASSTGQTNSVINQQQQSSPLMNPIDPATVAAMRQQASPLPPFLGPESIVPFRSVFSDAPDLFGASAGLFPSQNMAYAAQQMINVMNMTGKHPSAAALAELYSNADPYFRMNAPPNEVSRDPYNVQWQGNLILKNDQAYVKTQLVAGSPHIARASMNYWNSDSLPSSSSNLQTPSPNNLRISQRMRLEQAQLEGVQKRMQMDNDHCILIAEPNGSTPDEIRMQQNNLKNGVIRYFDEKKAAGIVNVLLPGASQPAYVVHIFPPCQFASEILQKRAPDTYRCVVQNKIEQIYLLIVITSTVQ